jgi:hypothetical protein
MNDLFFAELINVFDGVDAMRPVFDKPNNVRFWRVDGRPPILLWLKKTDPGHRSSNISTPHSDRLLESGQTEMLPNAAVLMLGYQVSDDRMGVKRISITPPCGRRSHPAWWIDVTLPNVVAMNREIGSNLARVTIRRSSHQRRLEA